ncbi:MAG: hypothetical protein EA353_13955, partial [Puniceicoccaceae bacterium]
SFLDCLCCGFGAILLIFLLTIGASDQLGDVAEAGETDIRALMEELSSLEAEADRKAALYAEAVEAERSQEVRQSIRSEIEELESLLAAQEREVEELQAILNARQEEAAAADRLLRSFPYEDTPPIGLPTDATHVVFVIDTSGSMRNMMTGQMHPTVVGQINYVLDNLPAVRFVQFIDHSGVYMMSRERGSWIPDSPALRREAQVMVRDYPRPSASDPERGMRRAFTDLLPQTGGNDRMSMFVFGDDVRRATATLVHMTNQLNPRDRQTGERPVTISAVAFPMLIRGFNLNNVDGSTRFANVMREIVESHGGVLILSPL